MRLHEKASTEVLLMVCVFAICCDPNLGSTEDLGSPDLYSDFVRTSIMMTIARGEVNLNTLQCLCLLSHYNYAGEKFKSEEGSCTEACSKYSASSTTTPWSCTGSAEPVGSRQ